MPPKKAGASVVKKKKPKGELTGDAKEEAEKAFKEHSNDGGETVEVEHLQAILRKQG